MLPLSEKEKIMAVDQETSTAQREYLHMVIDSLPDGLLAPLIHFIQAARAYLTPRPDVR